MILTHERWLNASIPNYPILWDLLYFMELIDDLQITTA